MLKWGVVCCFAGMFGREKSVCGTPAGKLADPFLWARVCTARHGGNGLHGSREGRDGYAGRYDVRAIICVGL